MSSPSRVRDWLEPTILRYCHMFLPFVYMYWIKRATHSGRCCFYIINHRYFWTRFFVCLFFSLSHWKSKQVFRVFMWIERRKGGRAVRDVSDELVKGFTRWPAPRFFSLLIALDPLEDSDRLITSFVCAFRRGCVCHKLIVSFRIKELEGTSNCFD